MPPVEDPSDKPEYLRIFRLPVHWLSTVDDEIRKREDATQVADSFSIRHLSVEPLRRSRAKGKVQIVFMRKRRMNKRGGS